MIKDLNVIVNKNLGKLHHEIVTHVNGNSYLNVTITTYAIFTKMWAYLKVRVPLHENDRDYRAVVLNTVQDVEKLLHRGKHLRG